MPRQPLPLPETAPATARASSPASNPKRGLGVVLAGLMLAMGLAALDQNIVNTALPRITADLGGVQHLSWVVTAFLLTSTISTPLYGKLSDMYGRRRMMVISIAIFLVGSILCGVASSMLQLIAFRALQGAGAGGLMTIAQTIIADLVTPRERGRYQGLFTGVFAISSLAGPLIGGALTTALSWRWVFYVNLPLGALALALLLAGLHRSTRMHSHKVDYLGAALLAGFTSALLLLLSWGPGAAERPLALAGITGGVGLGAILFVLQERRAAEPILRLNLFANRTFAAGAGATAVMAFAMMGALVFLPVYLQLVLGQSAFQAGLIVTPQIFGMLLSSVLGGRAVTAHGRVKPFLVTGVGLEAGALWGLCLAAAFAAPTWVFSCVVFALGLGMGIGMPNAVTAVQNAVDPRDMGVATGAMSFVRALGGALGVAMSGGVVSLVLALKLGHPADSGQLRALMDHGAQALSGATAAARLGLVDSYRHAIDASFLMSGVFMTSAFALVCTLPNDDLRGRETPSAETQQQPEPA